MKKLLLSGCLLAGLSTFAQTTLFQDDFESGASQWTLNGGVGDNSWTVNNSYAGFSGLIPDTPNQPGTIASSPQSNYLHIVNGTICSALSVCNANFDTGSTSNQTAQTSSGVSTLGMTGTTVSFWYLCAGSTGTSYGTLEYSIDGGSSWVLAGTYVNVSTWTQETLTMPVWDNLNNLLFRFHWQNGGAGSDPAFSVDDVLITATAGASASISTDNSFAPGNWCYDDVVSGNIGFVATGTFTSGNVFTAELSDASGSFASPTTIGTLPSTSSGSLTIPVTISAGTLAGTGYRIRVNSSAPSAIGTDNGTDLVIYDLPVVSLGTYTSVCDYTPVFTLTGGLPAGGTYSGTGVGTGLFDPSFAGLGTHTITYSYVDVNGCENSATQSITIDGCLGVDELSSVQVTLFPNPANSEFSISGTDADRVELIDNQGKLIKVYTSQNENYSLENVQTGVYSVLIYSNTSRLTTKLVVN